MRIYDIGLDVWHLTNQIENTQVWDCAHRNFAKHRWAQLSTYIEHFPVVLV